MKSISQIVGENLKQRMKELGLTQKTLADKMGLTQPNVHRWVSGEVMPDKITQKKLCKVLDCPIKTANESASIKHSAIPQTSF